MYAALTQEDQSHEQGTVVGTLDTAIPQAAGAQDAEAQRQWEQYARDRGVVRYRYSLVRTTQDGKTAQRSLADLEPGQRLTQELVGPLVERVLVLQDEAHARVADPRMKKLPDETAVLLLLEADVIAVTAVLSALSRCEPAPLQSCCLELGGRLQREVELYAWKKREKSAQKEREEGDAPWEPNMHELMVKRNDTVDERVFTKWSKKAKLFVKEDWSTATRLRMGMVLLSALVEQDAYFEVKLVRDGAKTRQMFQLTDTARQWVAQRHHQNELMRPLMLPMICEPRDYHYLPPAASDAISDADE
ncbi:hypothetical protein [Xylophilus sp.]|uniref:hypothetical protein n=1 Tax=Xylophilus sp. TaxID=2653893 RepID=UPI0013B7EF41|nr:hypothetical protein [Xylophilus sp.]KAF1049357.1 MAG: hypothetical protein GAK38_00813 [Xylophilus sp.]